MDRTESEPANYPNPESARLDLLVGPWTVLETHYDPKGEVVATTKGTEEITWIVDRHAIRRTYTTGTAPSVYKAVGLLAWNAGLKKYRGSWVDNVSTTGPNLVTGEWNDSARTIIFDIEATGKDGSPMRYRVVEQLTDSDHRVATTYLLQGGEVIKQLEVQYERAAPCPDRIRVIYEDLEVKRPATTKKDKGE